MTPADILPYLMAIIGFLIIYVLNGIKAELKEVKNAMQGLERDLREDVTGLDRRITAVESRCHAYHREH